MTCEQLGKKYPVGTRLRVVYYLHPLDIKEGKVTGIDCQDRVLVEFCLGQDSRGKDILSNGSIHVKRILPKKI